MERKHLVLVAVACLISTCLVVVATWHGVGLSPDSLQYLAAGQSAAAGQGLTTVAWEGVRVPLSHYPPGYPLLLSAGAWLGMSVETTARFSNMLLFAVTLVLVALAARRIAPSPAWVVPVASFSAAMTHDLVVVHSMAWSEPLYLTLTLGGLLALAVAIDRQSTALLIVAAMAAAASSIVRYVGIANVGLVGLVTLLWWRSNNKWMRIGTPALLSTLMVLPLLVTLLLGTEGSGGAVANRRFVWHPPDMMDMRIAASVVAKWMTPLDDAGFLSVAWLFALSVLAAAMFALRARQTTPSDLTPEGKTLTLILLLYALLYTAVIALSMAIVDAQTTFEPRMLAPVLAVAIIVGVSWLARQSRRGHFVRLAGAGILGLVLSANGLRWLPWLREAQANGLGLRRHERDAENVLAAVRRLPTSATIYSNDPYYVRAQTQRPTLGLPRTRDPNSLLPNAGHAAQVEAICESAITRPTFLILFDAPVSGDSTARAAVAHAGEATRLTGGTIVQVRAGCHS